MIRFYPLIIGLQCYCLYHAYTNKTDQKWYWIIIIFPFIGSLIYLYSNFYSRRNIERLSEDVKGSFVKNYKITKLEKNLKFSDTFFNKMELASEYSNLGQYERALEIYESCREGIYVDDPALLKKLMRNHYALEHFEKVTQYGLLLKADKGFKNSDEKSMFAWAHYNLGDEARAIELFEELDVRLSNYQRRIEYVQFLIHTDKSIIAREKINILKEEIDSMDSYERRLNKSVIKELRILDKNTSQ